MKITLTDPKKGVNYITRYGDLEWDHPSNPKMDFALVLLDEGDKFNVNPRLENAVLLMEGKVKFVWKDKDGKENSEIAGRNSLWTEDPWCLHTAPGTEAEIVCLKDNTELAVFSTPNDRSFPSVLYTPKDCRSEERGKGTMRETSTRIVRTIFDDSNAPLANLVLGEDINYPGKWSSYPPHWHPQPEIYHYRFLPEQGFGFGMLGEDAVQVHHRDTVLIFNEPHSQTSAPGYAMYYIWAIRHLDGCRYGPSSKTPIFDKRHLWVTDPENQKKIFPPED